MKKILTILLLLPFMSFGQTAKEDSRADYKMSYEIYKIELMNVLVNDKATKEVLSYISNAISLIKEPFSDVELLIIKDNYTPNKKRLIMKL